MSVNLNTSLFVTARAALQDVINTKSGAANVLADEIATLITNGLTDIAQEFIDSMTAHAPGHARLAELQAAVNARPEAERSAYEARAAKRAAYYSPASIAAREAEAAVKEAATPPLEKAREALRVRMQAELDAQNEATRGADLIERARQLRAQADSRVSFDPDGAAVIIADAAAALYEANCQDAAASAIDDAAAIEGIDEALKAHILSFKPAGLISSPRDEEGRALTPRGRS